MKKVVLIVFLVIVSYLAVSQSNLSATKAAFIKGVTESEDAANEHGVYPVLLEWVANGECDSFSVFRNDVSGNEDDWKVIGHVPYRKNADDNRVSFVDKNEDAVPNKAFMYKVSSQKGSKTLQESNVALGYGALTALCYMDTYNESIIASHNKLTLMHKRFNLAKLGKEAAVGDKGGNLTYHAKVHGFSGLVLMKYDNFEEFEEWTLNGNTNIKANIRANGKMSSVVECSGMYPGKVYYDNIKIKKGKANGGFYTISREGFPNKTVVWDAIQSEINHLYHESEESPESEFAKYEVAQNSE